MRLKTDKTGDPPSTAWIGAALLRLAVDGASLFLFFFLLACISVCLGLPHWGYFAINAVVSLLLLPGWLLARRWPSSRPGCVCRFYHASLISFVLYGAAAFVCTWLHASFQTFYWLYAGSILATAAASLPVYRSGSVRDSFPRGQPARAAAIAILLAFVCCAYRYPLSNDISQFTLQQQDLAYNRTFTPSPIGMTAFGITEPMPRWRAYLFHVLFSLMADLTKLPVEAVVLQWATIPMAIMALAATFFFVRAVVGQQAPSWAILAAILGPATLVWRNFNAYDYSFRLTNNFCLDKDFALFFLLPSMLYLSARILRRPSGTSFRQGPGRGTAPLPAPGPARGRFIDGVLLVAFAIPGLWFHPMTPVYYAMSLPALVAGFWPTASRRKVLFLGGCAAALLALALAKGDAQLYHQHIDHIARLDRQGFLKGRPLHYWPGHYGAIPGVDTDTLTWRGGRLALRSGLFTGNSLILYSAVLTAAWSGMLLVRRRTNHPPPPEEWRSYRAQLAYLAILAGIAVCSPIILGKAPHLYRGYERLHWFYLGMFSLVYSGIILQNGATALAERLSRVVRSAAWLTSAACWALAAAFWLHLVDQTAAIHQNRAAISSRIPHVHSIFDYLARYESSSLAAAARGRCLDAGSVPPRPAYLREEDRVLPITDLHGKSWYWLQRQGIWWRELYGEAFAYAVQGPAFLEEYEAFYDGVDQRLSPRFLRWVGNHEVNLIVFEGGEEFVGQLGRSLGAQVEELEPSVWRFEWPKTKLDRPSK
ncbi:MAG: hypothetical protein ACOX1P_17905 [Thermoguttaceae bacterium]|jgi:hypothetical protein